MSRPKPISKLRRSIVSRTLPALIVSCSGLLASINLNAAEVDIPDSAREQVNALTGTQRDFISDETQLRRFNLTPEKVYTDLSQRNPESARNYVEALIALVDEARYQGSSGQQSGDSDIPEPLNPPGQMASIPLNTEAGTFNRGILRPPIFDERERAPGLINLDRYMNQTDGIPTFADAPIAVRQRDLVAGDAEVAFVGAPVGLSSGWRDSQHAPKVLRGMYGMGGYDTYAGINPSVELTIADYGDVSIDDMAPELNNEHVRMMIGGMAEVGVVPFIVGGDHSLMFPTVAAMSDNFSSDGLGVVHMDAHYRGQRDLAHYYSDLQPVSRLLEEGLLDGENLIQVGLRGSEMSHDALAWMRDQEIRYHTMAEVEHNGWATVMSNVIEEARNGPDNIFISFDMSVMDPAYASGAGRPVTNGLTTREVLPLVRRLCAETNVVGFEMLDVAPYLDLSYRSAMTANSIMHSCLTGIAMRKKGLTDENYLDPWALDHGQ